eukprot:TRINITY_DN14514_c0_g1_i2.p1 TRINITY_DN14514_c0_g1~~TRINITY_DN14514_c0_g1_i2.p1  ORF type:complete len:250 (+),score=55.36 TRINITY_DN14514_c0_g1_i2:74-823(+)
MLPSSSSLSCASTGVRLPEYFRRMVRVSQMDFDLALAQMMYLCTSPEKAFRDAKHRKLTKNHWSRDDPAFVVLLVCQIICVCIGYYVALWVPEKASVSLLPLFHLIFYEVFVNFLCVALVVSTLFWYLSNKYLHGRGQMHEVRQPLEWQYAFDIHCNALFNLVMICGVAQLLLLPVLLHDTFVARALANLLYAFAFSVYFYVSFRGYVELPFLEGQEYFLYPVFFIALCYVLSLVTTFNCTSWVMGSWL